MTEAKGSVGRRFGVPWMHRDTPHLDINDAEHDRSGRSGHIGVAFSLESPSWGDHQIADEPETGHPIRASI
jgi:hypothetical protein